jgi:group I intron endonuclease
MKITIYSIVNITNQKVYIGQTKRFKTRIRQHVKSSEDVRCVRPIGRAIKKYGIQNFEISILEEVESELADERERYWIAKMNATNPEFGYNLESGGNCLKSLSLETREKIGKSRRKWYENLSEDELSAYRSKRKNPERTPEGAAAIKAAVLSALVGVNKTPEHKEKIRQAQLTRICKSACRCAKCIPKLKLSTDQIKKLQLSYQDGETVSALAKEYGITQGTARKYAKMHFETDSSNDDDNLLKRDRSAGPRASLRG